MTNAAATGIDGYLDALPEQSRKIMQEIRRRMRAAAPTAVEGIKYGMPTAALNGRNILYYAAWKKHVALYPIYRSDPELETALAPYRDKKDTVRFMLNQPVPYDLIEQILAARLRMMALDASAAVP